MLNLRSYQSEAVSAVYDHLRNKDNNPCIVLPTGTGKSIVIAKIVADAVSTWGGRVLILAHVKELLEQNAGKVRALCPEIPIGIFSAGLKSRDTDESVIVAGIQSVYNKACDLGAFDLIIVDEAHLVAPDGDGMYRTFLKEMAIINPRVRVIGLTATPFRLKGGLICKPENILNEVCYEAGLKEMIQQGYLSPLISRAGKVQAELNDLHVRGGEFINSEIIEVMDKDEITNAACAEIVSLTAERKSVLIFATSVEHCQHIADKIQRFSMQECAIVTGETPPSERAEILARFRRERVAADLFGAVKPPIKYLVNVNVLTTGFDAPNTDCVVLLRPTASPGLLIQMVGRGTRLSPKTDKTNCLVLDYGENILRHGPVDCITVKEKMSGKGQAPAKKCPQCLSLIHAGYMKCPECGYEFPASENCNLQNRASDEGILSGQVSYSEYDVTRTNYSIHQKKGAGPNVPCTMRVDYEIGFYQYKSEWVCPEHTGYAREKFVRWWNTRAALNCSIPSCAADAVALAQSGVLAEVKQIKVKHVSGEKYDTICGFVFGDRPVLPEPGCSDDDVEWASNSPADLGVAQKDDWLGDDAIPF